MDKFLLVGLKANLPTERDTDKLYWCSDTRELYKGADLYTEAVRVSTTQPENPATGILYLLGTGEACTYTGTEWVTVAKPYVTEGTLSADSTINQVPTAKVVYDSIVEAVSEATSGGDVINNITSTKAGTITVAKGDQETDVAIAGVVVTPSYDASTRTITLPYADGTESLVIALGKDIFLDSEADNKYNADNGNIELHLNDGTMISIPAASLIDVYTGVATNSVTVSVSDLNEITADIKLSSKEGNRATISSEEGEEGLLVDVSDLATAESVATNTAAIATLNANDQQEGSVDYKIAAAVAIEDATIAANTAAIATLNANDQQEGSVDYKIAAAKTVIDASITEVSNAAGLNTEAIAAINNESTGILAQAKTYADENVTWGTF